MKVSYLSYVKGSTRKGKALRAATGTSVETLTVEATHIEDRGAYVCVHTTDGRKISMPRALLVEVV